MQDRTADVLQWCRECEGLSYDEVIAIGQPGDGERLNDLVRLGLLDTLHEGGAAFWIPRAIPCA